MLKFDPGKIGAIPPFPNGENAVCRGDIFPVKMITCNIKDLYIQYIQHNVYLCPRYKYKYKCFEYKCISLYVVQFKWAIDSQENFVS